MIYRQFIFSTFAIFLVLILGADASTNMAYRDWKNLSRNLGWGSFNSAGEPFDAQKNLDFCDLRTIEIEYRSDVRDYSNELEKAFLDLRKSDPPGGTVLLGPGIFPTGVPINVTSYSCLVGTSMGKTTLRLVDNATTFGLSGIVRSYSTEHITIANLTIDGNKNNQDTTDTKDLKLSGDGYGRYGLYTYLSNYLYLQRVRVVNNLGYGFDPHGSKKDWAYFLIIDGCEAEGNGLDGFTIDQTMYVLVKNCRSISNGRHGINVVTGTRYIAAVNNTMKTNGFAEGVGCNFIAQNNQLKGTKEVMAIHNVLYDGRKSGFCFNDVSDIHLYSNTIKNMHKRAYCVHLVDTTNMKAKNNTCESVQS